MAARPLASVWSAGASGIEVTEQVKIPAVFSTPVRTDIVHHVHRDIAKNKRQAYAVNKDAGHQTSAESWGTGRAVSRIPRVPGGGTHRAGQGAFGNMCRGGRMFAPTKTWRRWHRRVNLRQRRFAICAALAASASPSLVMARGHPIEQVAEIPLIVANESISSISKTKNAVELMKKIGAYQNVIKTKASKNTRAGKGKMRNRRYRQRKGPLVVYNNKGTIYRAFRNIPGVECCSVTRLNLLQLAPGGHVGRFIIWTKDAFERLNSLYGSHDQVATEKKGYKPPRSKVTVGDLGRILQSEEIQSVLRQKQRLDNRFNQHKKNPLKNVGVMHKLNPYARVLRRQEILRSKINKERRAKRIADKKAGKQVAKRNQKHDNKAYVKKLLAA